MGSIGALRKLKPKIGIASFGFNRVVDNGLTYWAEKLGEVSFGKLVVRKLLTHGVYGMIDSGVSPMANRSRSG